MPLIRRVIRSLARTANWRCPRCDTWNDATDSACLGCG